MNMNMDMTIRLRRCWASCRDCEALGARLRSRRTWLFTAPARWRSAGTPLSRCESHSEAEHLVPKRAAYRIRTILRE
jgi:hypothetical protein